MKPGKSVVADSGTTVLDGLASVDVTLPTLPGGSGAYFALQFRGTGVNGYRAKLRVQSDGSLRLGASKVVNGVEQSMGSTALAGAKVTSGTAVHLQAAISGTSTAKLVARAWVGSQAPGAWQFSVNDPNASVLSNAQSVTLWGYLSAESAPVRSSFSGLQAVAAPAVPAGTVAASPTPSATATSAAAEPTKFTPTPAPVAAAPAASVPAQSAAPAAPDPAQPAATGKPGPNNTGVPSGTKLTVHEGDLVITKDGATYDRLDVHGFVDVRAKNVTITRSIIRGGTATSNKGIVTVTNAAADNFVIEDSELSPSYPSVWLDALKGANFTARRINAHGGVDAVKVHGNNVAILDSYLHDTHYYASDPNQGGGPTHNDGVQVLGGNNIKISGNTISGGPNAGIQVTQDYAAVVGLSITNNWITGGTCNVKLNHKKLTSMATVVIDGNTLGGGSSGGCTILRTAATSLAAAGNSMGGALSTKITVDG